MTPRPGDLVVTRWGAWFAGRRLPCAVGRGGVGTKRGEGDGVTPVGVWRIESLWWRADRRGRPLGGPPARPVGPRDGWGDDPATPDYNRAVRLPVAGSAERLRRADRLYDLIAVLDFNRAPVRAGAGSAIFLHVWRGPRRPTAGCVAFRANHLAWVLSRWRMRGRIVIR